MQNKKTGWHLVCKINFYSILHLFFNIFYLSLTNTIANSLKHSAMTPIKIYVLFSFILGYFQIASLSAENTPYGKKSASYYHDSTTAALYNKKSSELLTENTDSSIWYSLKGLEIAARYHDESFMYKQIQLLNNLGNAYSIQSNYVKSIEYYLKASQLTDTLIKINPTEKSYKQGLVVFYSNMGILYYLDHKYEQSLSNYLKAKSLFKYLTNNEQKGQILNNIAIIYMEQKKYYKSIDYYNQALRLFKKESIESDICMIYNNLGEVYNKIDKKEEALSYLKKAYKIKKELKDNYGMEVSLYTMAEVFYTQQAYDSAIFYGTKSLAIAKKIKNKHDIIKITKLLSESYAGVNNFKYAYKFLVQEKQLNDSLYHQENEKQLQELQAKYESQQRENEIIALKAKEEKSRMERKMTIFSIVALVLIFLMILIFLFNKRKHEKQLLEKELEKKKIKTRELNHEITFKTKQLTTHALNMMQKNNMLQEIQQSIDDISTGAMPEVSAALSNLKRIISANLNSDKDWEMFKIYFEQIDSSFYTRLTDKYPKLNTNDFHHCALIKLNMNLKETASVLNLSPNTIKSARNRLKKKLGLSATDDLFTFIRSI